MRYLHEKSFSLPRLSNFGFLDIDYSDGLPDFNSFKNDMDCIITAGVYSKKSDDRHHSGNFHRPYLDHGWLHRNDGVDDHYGCE